MKIAQEARVLDFYQKTTIEIQPGELKQVIKINQHGGDMDTEELEKKLGKVFNDLFKNFDSGKVS
ncbi:MAG: hypothetical protein LKF37_05655 [Lentilactobacillus diolivorans]|jgi:hypothetical protein|nr:hypothetical protein [Lentilactobacillus diolivorans]RRG01358.1 MAG: hypothetical protein DUD34_12275 [Lactobacillus sp.]